MKRLMELILSTKIGNKILALILKRFVDSLQKRSQTIHGPEGITISKFLLTFEPEIYDVFIAHQSPDEMFETIGHFEKDLILEEVPKVKEWFANLIGKKK